MLQTCRSNQFRIIHNFTVVFNWTESNSGLLWFCFTTFLTNDKPKLIVTCCRRFPALGAGYIYLPQILIGSLCCLRLLWLARVITWVTGFQFCDPRLKTAVLSSNTWSNRGLQIFIVQYTKHALSSLTDRQATWGKYAHTIAPSTQPFWRTTHISLLAG